jgi:tetratricopeptide (TPR) repeat protein
MSTVRAAAVITLILGTMLIAGCSGAEARRESYIKRGQEYFAQGDYARATIEFRNAMQVKPKDPQARLLAGEAAERLGRFRDAAGLFQSVVESNPENVQARVDLGQIFDFGGVPQRALKLIAPSLIKHPNSAPLLTVRGMARAQLKDYAGALTDAQRAVQLDPTYEQAVGLLAALYRAKHEDAQAEMLVNSTLQKLPRSTQLREVLADIYAQTGDDADAEKQFQMLIAIRPTELHYREQLARVDVHANQLDQAEAVLHAAVQAAPQSDQAKLLLVSFLTDHRSPAQGEATLRSFIAAQPDDSGLRLALGAALERSGQTDQALNAYGQVVQQDVADDDPNALIARDRSAAIYMSEGHNDAAAAEVAKVLKRDPSNDGALMIRGNLELTSGQPTAAITDLRAVLRDEPGLVDVHRLAAQALIASGDTALAEDQLETAIEIAPDDANTRLELAQIYLQAGDRDRAVTVLEQSVQRLPTDGPLREALVRAYIAKGDFHSANAQADSMTAALPHSGAGPYLEGLIAEAQKQYAPAEADFEEALKRQPRALSPLLDLTRLEISLHQESMAAANLQRMVKNDPANGLALEMLGELDIAHKAYPQAVAELSQAVKFAPGLWYAYRNLALAKADGGDTAGAIAAYQAGIKVAPDQPVLVGELASYYIRQQQPDNAIALYQTLYQREPGSPAVASNLALLLATYRSDQQSLDRARRLSAQFATSNDGALLDTSGWVLLKSGDLQHALPVLHRAELRDPGSDLIRYHIGMAELQSGDRAKAQADLKAAVAGSQAFPGMSDAREKLASLQSGSG